MVSYRMIAVAGLLASVGAVPLNINLGAYSPALVVGDGEISFGGGEDVSNLMNVLEGAAVSGATSTAAAATEGAAVPAADTPAVAAAEENAVTTEEIEQNEEVPPETATPAVDPALQEQAQQISALQGMGKEIAPREGAKAESKAKRDLASFDRALTFAEAALTKGPLVDLGTGEGGSGVGITVDNNAGTGGVAKREETSPQPRRRTKVTRMYIKRGIPAAIQESNEFEARSIELPTVPMPAIAKRGSTSEAIDAINLNVAGDEGVTMTFVETGDDVDDEAPVQ
ncbi:hypothetical protein F4780DRAFT_88328 [Xylariomycetidae sp. FL0641]|nr:hypothetical protein F4780DRAFT_88328 [Xylariomycetidae sp. FL0641]